MSSRGRIAEIALAVAYWTTLAATLSAKPALTTCGKGRRQVGKRKWGNPKERAEKEKVAKGKEKSTREIWGIESRSRTKQRTTAFATIGLGGTDTVNLGPIATSSMKDQKGVKGKTLPRLWLLRVNQIKIIARKRNLKLPL